MRHHALVGLHLGDDRLGDLALVEGVLALRLDQPQRLGQVGVPDDAVERRRVIAVEERGARIGIREQPLDAAAQVAVPAFGQAPALFGGTRGRLERLLEAHRAEAREQRVVAGDGARHRGGVHARARHPLLAQLGEEFRRPPGRRPARGGEGVELLLLRHPDDGEQVPADAGVVLGGDVEHGAGGHRGVDGVAALAQDVEPGLRRQRVAGGDDAVAGDYLRAPLAEPALRPGPGDRLDVRRRLRRGRGRLPEGVLGLGGEGGPGADGETAEARATTEGRTAWERDGSGHAATSGTALSSRTSDPRTGGHRRLVKLGHGHEAVASHDWRHTATSGHREPCSARLLPVRLSLRPCRPVSVSSPPAIRRRVLRGDQSDGFQAAIARCTVAGCGPPLPQRREAVR